VLRFVDLDRANRRNQRFDSSGGPRARSPEAHVRI
jgi:hypothetical protein